MSRSPTDATLARALLVKARAVPYSEAAPSLFNIVRKFLEKFPVELDGPLEAMLEELRAELTGFCFWAVSNPEDATPAALEIARLYTQGALGAGAGRRALRESMPLADRRLRLVIDDPPYDTEDTGINGTDG